MPAGVWNWRFGHFFFIRCADFVQTGAPSRWRYHYTPKAAKFWGGLGGGIGASVMEGLWRDTSVDRKRYEGLVPVTVDPYRPSFTPCLQPCRVYRRGFRFREAPDGHPLGATQTVL
jgi:hypothetical protein